MSSMASLQRLDTFPLLKFTTRDVDVVKAKYSEKKGDKRYTERSLGNITSRARAARL